VYVTSGGKLNKKKMVRHTVKFCQLILIRFGMDLRHAHGYDINLLKKLSEEVQSLHPQNCAVHPHRFY
jgi:hypothetical protein